ncbi:hypothetical protein PG995_014275 [Apiospora arundinis]
MDTTTHASSPTQPTPAAVAPQHHQQQQQIAQPYPQQPGPYYAYGAQPRVIPFDKKWYWAKLALTLASVLFSVILLGLGLGISLRPTDTFYTGTYAWVIVPVVVVCIIWDLAELITLFTCGRHRKGDQQQPQQEGQKQSTARDGIHPGAHVGVDLVLWLAGIFVVLFTISGSVLDGYSYRYECEEFAKGGPNYYSTSYYEKFCSPSYLNDLDNFYKPAARAISAFACLLTLTHFVIFVRACIETNLRNRMRGPVVMVPTSHMSMYIVPGQQQAGMMPMMPPQSHYMAPGHQGSAPMNEKAAAGAHPQTNTAPSEGFYAPNPSTNHAGQAV